MRLDVIDENTYGSNETDNEATTVELGSRPSSNSLKEQIRNNVAYKLHNGNEDQVVVGVSRVEIGVVGINLVVHYYDGPERQTEDKVLKQGLRATHELIEPGLYAPLHFY